MKKWITRVIIIAVIAFGIGIFAYNYLINKASEEITKQISEMENLAENSGELKDLEKMMIKNNKDDSLKKDENPTVNNNEPLKKDEKVNSENATAGTQGKQAVHPNGAAKEKINNQNKSKKLSFSSKQEAIRFGLSKFSVSEINRLRKMASNGLTPEEKAEIKRIVFSRFSQSEINEIRKALSS